MKITYMAVCLVSSAYGHQQLKTKGYSSPVGLRCWELGALVVDVVRVPAGVLDLGVLAAPPDVHQVVDGEVLLVVPRPASQSLDSQHKLFADLGDVRLLHVGVGRPDAVVAGEAPPPGPAVARVEHLAEISDLFARENGGFVICSRARTEDL